MSREPLELRLATDAGRRTFDHELAAMIRGGRFDAAEAVLIDTLDASRTKIAAAARATTANGVRIAGWPEVHAACVRLLAAGTQIGAVGLNLSNYNDSSTSVWHDKEPAIEFAVYANRPFDFSSATVDEILRVSAEPPAPWQGRMMAAEAAVVPSISGLRSLNSALLEYANDAPWRPSLSNPSGAAAPDEYVAFAAGEWLLHLRFHQAVSRDVKQFGLPSLVPVLIGAHDVGPFIVSVVVPDRAADPPRVSAVAEPRRVASGEASVDPGTEQSLADLDEMRRAIQGMGFFARGRRRTLVEQSEARESQLLASVGLAWPRRTHDMSDTQFAAFAHAVRLARGVS